MMNYLIHYNILDEKATDFTDFLDDLSITCEVCDRSPEPYQLQGHISESEL